MAGGQLKTAHQPTGGATLSPELKKNSSWPPDCKHRDKIQIKNEISMFKRRGCDPYIVFFLVFSQVALFTVTFYQVSLPYTTLWCCCLVSLSRESLVLLSSISVNIYRYQRLISLCAKMAKLKRIEAPSILKKFGSFDCLPNK